MLQENLAVWFQSGQYISFCSHWGQPCCWRGLRTFDAEFWLEWRSSWLKKVFDLTWMISMWAQFSPPCANAWLLYLFDYKPSSAITQDPKLLRQKINLINSNNNCKCIILSYKPRASLGLDVYYQPWKIRKNTNWHWHWHWHWKIILKAIKWMQKIRNKQATRSWSDEY